MGVFHMTLTVALTTGQHYRAACDYKYYPDCDSEIILKIG